jgi:polyribonucleotide nucleotidyltransferase
LGCSDGSQEIDAITSDVPSKSFSGHYHFAPFSIGQTGKVGKVARHEIEHGRLGERSLSPRIPSEDIFSSSIRIVCDILESNGSSSMASVCGGYLAFMEVGIPISDTVAGLSIGLVTSNDPHGNIFRYAIPINLIRIEDHFGYIVFNLSGARNRVTDAQLDLKIQGLPIEIAREAIKQSSGAWVHLLDIMECVIPSPRESR